MTAAEIADLRKRLGLSQRELARRLAVSTRAVQMWEQGRRRPGGPATLMLTQLKQTAEGPGRKL